ncbi:SH3 domain-containing protein [Allorhodopirellula solitaria]|uniref:Uncharacterized protein n=1 Tax=Allorhodopirellula solitaria TaxID=2527987 RepID=A0A5C5YKM5_9BACT|nr:hypothetical protein [Allorhodopirellula solitaria]TWT75401.1 hypothetical protein CA85_06920 [Allorhodopirellula solitaria]
MRRSPLFSSPSRRSPLFSSGMCRCVMTAAAALLVFYGSIMPTAARAAEGTETSAVSDPYLVFVADAAAHLRCGPGGDYYRTDPLRHGQELEVYVEYADGWLGVRPTADSFCWIPADATRLLDATKSKSSSRNADAIDAEIIEDKTKAWIGTNLGRARRSRWQVQLGEGETVTILGRSERDGPDGPQAWYRIVPPSGEFRWIHRDQVVTTAEALIANMQPSAEQTEQTIEFLPGGPSHVARNDPAEQRADEIASIRRLDEIEKHIEERQRSRFDRLRQDEAGTALAGDPNAPNGQPNGHPEHHQLKSFSERVTDGLTALVSGQQAELSELEPLTGRSSRRPNELVPIGSGLATPATPTVASGPAAVPSPPVAAAPHAAPAQPVDAGQGSRVLSAEPGPNAKTVAATAHPEFRSSESQVAILSAPRMVASADVSPLAARGFAGQPLQPAKLRTITAAQLEGVQQSVAAATPESLPTIMSNLMARGASAPEIRIVADAAQRFSMSDLAQRAREYESLARRRDGDTLVATTSLPHAPTFAAAPRIPSPPAAQPAVASLASPPNNSFVSRAGSNPTVVGPASILPTSHTVGASPASSIGPPSAMPADNTPATAEQSGVLVEVYSADPDRPPFAITDQGGRTVAYVTPAPGVEIRNHLGSRVRVQGETGFLQGLDTPHVLATQAERLMR